MYLVTKVLLNLDRFYSILATIQYFKLQESVIMDQFVTCRKRVYCVISPNRVLGAKPCSHTYIFRYVTEVESQYRKFLDFSFVLYLTLIL